MVVMFSRERWKITNKRNKWVKFMVYEKVLSILRKSIVVKERWGIRAVEVVYNFKECG